VQAHQAAAKAKEVDINGKPVTAAATKESLTPASLEELSQQPRPKRISFCTAEQEGDPESYCSSSFSRRDSGNVPVEDDDASSPCSVCERYARAHAASFSESNCNSSSAAMDEDDEEDVQGEDEDEQEQVVQNGTTVVDVEQPIKVPNCNGGVPGKQQADGGEGEEAPRTEPMRRKSSAAHAPCGRLPAVPAWLSRGAENATIPRSASSSSRSPARRSASR